MKSLILKNSYDGDMMRQNVELKGSVPAPEATQNLDKAAKNMVWLANNRNNLRKSYPNKYVAVDDEEVVSSNEDVKKLILELKTKYKNVDHIAIDYVGEKEVELILPY